MPDIPDFKIYGDHDEAITSQVQPNLELRSWKDLSVDEKKIILRELKNNGWVSEDDEILATIAILNDKFLRLCPGKNLHLIKPEKDHRGFPTNDSYRKRAALADFEEILLNTTNENVVLIMITLLAKTCIDFNEIRWAKDAKTAVEKKKLVDRAYAKFDRFSMCINYICEQFAINILLTRQGLVPRQDIIITENIYKPTLSVLSDPKWQSVSEHLAEMFDDFQNQNYPEVITKAHGAVQRFLQILTGEQLGKNGKGELASLFRKAKQEGLILQDQYSEPIIHAFQGYISSERANKSTAKPALQIATQNDCLLIMNTTLVFMQYCLNRK